jgi:hypothetical protein
MAEPKQTFAQFAGRVLFPRSPIDLTSTVQCPACFSALNSTICGVCGLDLNHPAAPELAKISADVAALLDRRLELIGQIRFETEQVRTTSAVPAAAPAPAPAPDPAPTFAQPSPAVLPAAVSAAVPEALPDVPRAPRRSSVQVLLLVVGVSLLSIAAIFFLVYAYINFGLIWQSIIIGAITVAAFTVASVLRRRGLRGTAEGIAAFAVVLVYLDVYAIRANNLFATQSADGLTYWGTALLVSAIVFVVWNRLSGLRVASLAGFAAVAPGAGLLVAGLTEPLDSTTRAFVAFAAIATAGLVHPFAVRTAEKVIPLSISLAGYVIAFFVGFFIEPNSDWASTFAMLALAVIAALHVAVIVRLTQRANATGVFARIFAAAAGVTATLAMVASAIRVSDGNFTVIAPVVTATTLALLLDFARRKLAPGLAQQSLRIAAISAFSIACLLFLIPFAVVVFTVSATVVGSLGSSSWRTPLTGSLPRTLDTYPTAIVAIAVVVALAAGFAALTGQLRARRVFYISAVLATLVLSVPLLATVVGIAAAWFALGAGCLTVVLVSMRTGRLGAGARAAFVVTAVSATLLGYAVSWASESSWLIGSIITVAVFFGLRSAASPQQTALRGVLLAVGVFVGYIAAAAGARALSTSDTFTLATVVGSVRFVGLLATVFLATAAIPRLPTISATDRRIVFWMSLPTAALAGAFTAPVLIGAQPPAWAGAILPEFTSSFVASAAFAAAVLVWAMVRSTASFPVERAAASVLIAPAIWWLTYAKVRDLEFPTTVRELAPIVAVLVVAIGELAVTLLRSPPPRRLAVDIGIAIVGVMALAVAVFANTDTTWLVLLLAGVTVLLLSISRDGLFAASGGRKYFGWLALALATSGFWWRLSGAAVTDIELYVLPLAGALLIIALLVWRSARSAGPAPSTSAPWIFLAALLIAIVPTSANLSADDHVQAIVIGAVSAALLLVGSFVVGSAGLRPYLNAAVLAGAAGVVIVTIGRGVALSNVLYGPDTRLDVWVGATFVILVIAAFGLARRVAKPGYAGHLVAASALVIIAMLLALFFVSSNLIDIDTSPTAFGTVRAITAVFVFSAVFVLAMVVHSPPLSRAVGWVAISFAALAFWGGFVAGAIDPLEFGTVPIAAALIAGGGVHLARTPSARSWAHLAPGLLVLFVPSLLATITDRPLWRLVAIGVAAVAVIVVGVVLRLQAPFVIGIVVALIHGVATFLPQIRDAYQSLPWWLWAGFGGVLLIVLAARYEHRIKNLKDAALRIGSLR